MSFALNANRLLLAHIQTAKERGIDYAPDNGGPHTAYIADMLRLQAEAWALDRQEAYDANVKVDGRATWNEAMAMVDERIRRYLAANNLARAA